MKKSALILLMVCFVLSLGAQEFAPAVTISGDATLSAGFNLEDSVFALKNSFSADLKLTLVAKNTAKKGSEETTYGWIELKDFVLEQGDVVTAAANDGTDAGTDLDVTKSRGLILTNPKITAKIISGPMFLQFMDESNATKEISAGGYSIPNITDGKFLSTFAAGPKSAATGSYVYAGYDSDMIDFTLKTANTGNYCTDVEGEWYFAPSAAVTVSGATIKAGAIFGTDDALDVAIGASVEYTLALNDKIKVVPVAGFDMKLNDDNDFGVGAGVFAKWGGNDEYDAYLNLAANGDCADTYKTGDDVKYQGGAGVSVQYLSASEAINVLVQVNEQRGDDGLVPGLGAAVGLELLDVTGDDMGMKFGAFANYKMNDITPFVRAAYLADDNMIFGAGVSVANVIPNTTFSAEYNSINLLGDNSSSGLITASVKVGF